MLFGNKRAEDVHPSEIEALVDQRVTESQSLDFKREPWGKTSSEKCERLRDIVSMANGGGGYILLGLVEDAAGRASKIARIPDAAKQVESILNAVTNGVEPRMSSIQVEVKGTSTGDVVLIRVPPGDPLYAVAIEQRTDYWCRYGTTKSRMTHEEIASAFANHIRENGMTDYAEDHHQPARVTLPSSAWQFRHLTDLQFDHLVGQRPYYRATLIPHDIDRSIGFGAKLRDLLSRPPRTRRSGFHIWELALTQSKDELVGLNESRGHEVRLHRNGFVEFRCPLSPESHETELRAQRGPLNPYPLIELPISFYRLVLSIYELLQISGAAAARHSYHNIRKFRLSPGVPRDDEFAVESPASLLSSRDVYIPTGNNFDADAVVYELIEEFYAAFGFGPEMIPLFDKDHHFQP